MDPGACRLLTGNAFQHTHAAVNSGPWQRFRLIFVAASVDERVVPVSGAFEVDGQHAAVELPGALGAADHALLLHEAEDGDVAAGCALDRPDPVQGVAALEQLQVAGFEDEGADAVAPVVEHGLHGLVVLVFGRAQRGDVLELTPGLTVLDRQCDGEVVGVEVPGEACAFFGEVDDDVGERVGVGKERLLAQCSADEVSEGRGQA